MRFFIHHALSTILSISILSYMALPAPKVHAAAATGVSTELFERIERLTYDGQLGAAEKLLQQWLKTTKPYPVQTSWTLTEYGSYYSQRASLSKTAQLLIAKFCHKKELKYTEQAFSIYKSTTQWLGDGPMERGLRVDLAKEFFMTAQPTEWVYHNIWPSLAFPEELLLPEEETGVAYPSRYYDQEDEKSYFLWQHNAQVLYINIVYEFTRDLVVEGKADEAKALIDNLKGWKGTYALKRLEALKKKIAEFSKF